MPRSTRIAVIAAIVPLALVVWASVVFAMDRVSNSGEVLGSVTVAGVDLGGLTESEARQTLQQFEARLSQLPVSVVVNGTTFELIPASIGFAIDEAAVVAEAMAVGREGGLPGQFGWWLNRLTGNDESVNLVSSYDAEALEEILTLWEAEAIADPPFEGAVLVDGSTAGPRYPRLGTGIDRERADDLIAAALIDVERQPIELPTRTVTPVLDAEDVDAAVAEAQRLIGRPVVLSREDPLAEVEFGPEVLGSALRNEAIVSDGDARIELSFDPDTLLAHVMGFREEVEVAPVNAQIVATPEETVRIIPSQPGQVVDAEQLAPTVMAAAASPARIGSLPLKEGSQPDFSTEDAEALNVNGLLYRATTYFDPGGDETNQNRVNNIQLIAAEVDGALVMPGATFSLNEYVGQRTLEEGYKPAGAIIGDDVYCCDQPANIGGGVSQFATTLYNAVFFSGLEDVEHTPHTLYFSRYPEGREATLGFPKPDVIFRNNTNAAVLIDTSTTDRSVTVRFYGDNGGLDVEAGLSDRRDPTEPFDTYEADPSLPPGEEKVVDAGAGGWTVTVYRYITHPDGSQTEESWVWRYRPFPRVIAVHPCSLPSDHPDYQSQCPVIVPNVVGKASGNAVDALSSAGLNVSAQDTFSCDPATQRNVVVAQNPGAGALVDPGTTVTISVCRQDTSDGGTGDGGTGDGGTGDGGTGDGGTGDAGTGDGGTGDGGTA